MSNGEPIVGPFDQKFNNLEKSYFQIPLDTCFLLIAVACGTSATALLPSGTSAPTAAGQQPQSTEVREAVVAFPLGPVGDAAINSEVDGVPVVAFTKSRGASVGAFSRQVAGRTLSFDYREDEDVFVDCETRTLWNSIGRAGSGPLEGERLELIATSCSFWFSVVISFPGVEFFNPESG